MNGYIFTFLLRAAAGLALVSPVLAVAESAAPVPASSVVAPAHPAAGPGGIGVEKTVAATFDRDDYRPKPQDDRTPLILQVGSVKPRPDGRHDYIFRYIGFEPGTYRLADYLIRPDGTPVAAGEEALVHVELNSILPLDFKGELSSRDAGIFPRIGGYRRVLWVLGALWVVALPTLLWFTRKKKTLVAVEVVVAPPTYAERMRPLIEAAATGTLAASGQAELERLITGYWREKLGRPELRMAESLAALKAQPEAGALLLALERWLHRPGGASPAEIDALLKPYASPASAKEGDA
jgi:hypothetical protein